MSRSGANTRKRCDPERDRDRLLANGTALLLAAGEEVTSAALAAVARTAPRGEEESRSPCGCGRCVASLILVERLAKDEAFRQFGEMTGFFLDEMSSWSPTRRARAEEALALKLGM